MSELTSSGPSVEAPPEAPKKENGESFISVMFDYVEIVVFSICAMLVLFMLVGRLCRVNGSSMCNTLYNGELLITTSIGAPDQGDIVVFHQTSADGRLNEPLVKRVIAEGGQTIRIDYNTCKVSVDGVELDEPYVTLINPFTGTEVDHLIGYPGYGYDPVSRVFEATVPDGSYFVMGDNRNNSADSRSSEVGFVDSRRMLGRVVLRMKPFTVFH